MASLLQQVKTKEMKKKKAISLLLIIGTFYFAFMILDRALSIIYGFNFQPFGPHMPPGFTFWGHILNGSAAALGLFLTFKLYDYGKKKGILFLKILPFLIFATIGALIPYFNDAQHLIKNGMGSTLPIYIMANDLYVFLYGLLVYKLAKSNRMRAILLLTLLIIFLIVHFVLYVPMFPGFYWS